VQLEAAFDRLHARVARSPWLQRFTAFTRVLLALGFLPSGLIKVLDRPFTTLGTDDPIGFFFDALYRTDSYYQFIGWGQVIAAVLLLLPWTARLGALVYFPIILNITVLTYALSFTGTTVITSLMLLGNVYLLAWEYPALKALLMAPRSADRAFGGREYAYQAGTFGLLTALAFAGLATLLVSFLATLGLLGVAAAFAAGSLFGLTLAWHLRHAVTSPSGHS
jgi:hypothetical protein